MAPIVDLWPLAPPPPCDIPSGCCSFTGPWTVTRSSLRMLRRVAAFCRPLRPVLLLVSFPRSQSPVVGVLGLPPPPPGITRWFQKTTHQRHIAQDCETSLSELLCTPFVLIHRTPQTSEDVPPRRYCAPCPFHKGACAGGCARPW